MTNAQISVKIEFMAYYYRKITPLLKHALDRGKSILLLGARQTGKSTLVQHEIKPDLQYSFIQPADRQRYESNPSRLVQDIEGVILQRKLQHPIIMIDEIQKIPLMMDVVQDLIDRKIGRFILTGSSARKLKHGSSINLLPGRVVLMHLDPLMLTEMPQPLVSIEEILQFGSLPAIVDQSSDADRNIDLVSYAKTYLEEEVRAEALVRNVGSFSRFLHLAASEAGQLINLSRLSQDVGVAHTTISGFYQVLEDCLIVERIDPLFEGSSRKRLSKAPKYLFFDLGIRRICAEEGTALPVSILGRLLEQFVGIELIRQARLKSSPIKIRYWRDHAGPEIDYVIEYEGEYIPVEVKWTANPTEKDYQHLKIFLKEYGNAKKGYLVCQTPKWMKLTENIIAIPWQDIHLIFE